ncbi:MAG: hypothetical protein JSS98_01925 [Bacteroidetes bacterium]|nr:hypothetical protein [Bacteroidota bacterium]
MPNRSSQHILNTSATLLGFCLFVITSLHTSNYASKSVIDEFTSGIALSLIFSCLFSFFSLRAKNINTEKRAEKIGEYFFGFALLGIMAIIILLLLDVIK